MSKYWTVLEEQFLIDNYGILPCTYMAQALNRSNASIRKRIWLLKKNGRLSANQELQPAGILRIGTVKQLIHECPECHTDHVRYSQNDMCDICKAKKLLAKHRNKMFHIYDAMPQELKVRTRCDFNIKRNKRLMSRSLNLTRPDKPDLTGLDNFYAAVVLINWMSEVEDYELALLKLDINAVKQRNTKWTKKIQRYYKEKKQQ